ncbi:MAG: hypothetical protein AB7U73_09860 [Pirellulales bacterium]
MKRLALTLAMLAATWSATPNRADAHGSGCANCSSCQSGCRSYLHGARGFGPYYFSRTGYYAPLNVGPGYGPGFGVGYGFY